MIWLTGDTHGHFDRVEAFCREQQTTTDDILIILGDSGFNFGGGERDRFLKTRASQFPITIFSLHGNRENRPQNIPGYVEGSFHGGKILYEPQYPNLLFAVDGEDRLPRRRRRVLHRQGIPAGQGPRLVAGRAALGRDKAAGRSPARAPRLADARRADAHLPAAL